jgi:hypothetical protein
MTAEEFKTFWASTYPKTIPVSWCLKYDYPERWFRIHSLPASKRYAANPKEWEILLDRQNKIITKLLGRKSKTIFVTGEYHLEGKKELLPISEVESIKAYSFTKAVPVNLHTLDPEEYEPGQVYKPIFTELTWEKNKFDHLLKEIADDLLKAFFISPSRHCILAPYDGGMDIILKDTSKRDKYKAKYADWLSEREDGY